VHNRERFYAIEIQGCVRGIRSIEGRRCLKGRGARLQKKFNISSDVARFRQLQITFCYSRTRFWQARMII